MKQITYNDGKCYYGEYELIGVVFDGEKFLSIAHGVEVTSEYLDLYIAFLNVVKSLFRGLSDVSRPGVDLTPEHKDTLRKL